MATCSFCNAGLTPSDVQSGRCPACGREFAPPAGASGGGPAAWDEEGGGRTFQADDFADEIAKTIMATWTGAVDERTDQRQTVKQAVALEELPSEAHETWEDPSAPPTPPAPPPRPQEPGPGGDALETWTEGAGTDEFVGDEFAPPPARTAAPERDTDAGDAARTLDEVGDEATRPDEFPSAGGAAAAAPPSGADEGADATLISDEFVPVEGAAAPETPPASEDSVEATFISDEFMPVPAEGEPVRTDSEDASAEQDSVEQTYLSDDFTAESSETLDSGEQGLSRKTDPDSVELGGLTAEEVEAGLVIRPRRFRQAETAGPADAEYELIRVLGEGGMGTVYDARQTSIDRAVAIKMLKKPKAERRPGQSAAARQKFLAEAVVTGDLDHPNIVPIYDVGRNDENALFYSMKRVQGTPWLDVVAKKSIHENLEILMRVADAVAFAHSRGVVHRDLKPENVMLGDYGEILLMDWGLALPTEAFQKGGTVTRSNSMGGTPAYMAPEMATGPLETIGHWSDVYLLGAILYEIVTGKPPHHGKTAMQCLMAAARNEIVPTDKTGELVDVALTAMATQPEDRYASVKDFQDAVRDYLSHSESVLLSTRAQEDLERARQTDDYADYQKAQFGFEEAHELWAGNAKARAGVLAAKLAYAQSALRKGDYDLGAGLLDRAVPEHETVYAEIQSAIRERAARERRLKRAKRIGVGLVASIVLVISGATVMINAARVEAIAARDDAVKAREAEEEERKKAVAAQLAAEEAREAAEEAREAEEEERKKAVAAQLAAEEARENEAEERRKAEAAEAAAVVARDAAEEERQRAEEQRQLAEAATRRALAEEREARYQAFLASIGLAAAKIDENAFDDARRILDRIDPGLRNWEWGRLMHLSTQFSQSFPEDGDARRSRVESVAVAPVSAEWSDLGDGRQRFRFATAGWEGLVRVQDVAVSLDAQGMLRVEPLDETLLLHDEASTVFAVAFQPGHDGRYVATGSDDARGGYVRLWDVETGELVRSLGVDGRAFDSEHTGAVLCLEFSHDGRRLLTGSADNSARLWDVESGRPIRRFLGHYGAVTAVAFAPHRGPDGALRDEVRFVTASDDGTAVVWTDRHSDGRWLLDRNHPNASPPFRGHAGPIYAAAFSPDGRRIATGGNDRQVLVWDPEQIVADDAEYYARRLAGRSFPQERPLELAGHKNAVQSVSFSSDGSLVLSGSLDNTLIVWDLASGEPTVTLRGHQNPIRSCVFGPGDKWILSGSHDQTAKFWATANYEEFRQFRGRSLDGHQGTPVLAATFAPGGESVVTASEDLTAKAWSLADAREPTRVFREGHELLASRAVFFPDGTKFVSAALDNTARVWDRVSGMEILKLDDTGRSYALALSGDGRWLLTGGYVDDPGAAEERDRQVSVGQLWDAEALIAAARAGNDLPPPVLVLDPRTSETQPSWREITALAISPDNKWLFTGDREGRCRLWDRRTGREVHYLAGHDRQRIVAAAFTSDSRRLLTASMDRTVVQWDVASGKAWESAEGRRDGSMTLKHPDQVLAMALVPGERRVLTSCADGLVRIWDLDDVRPADEVPSLRPRGGMGTLQQNAARRLRRRAWSDQEFARRLGLPAETPFAEVFALPPGERERRAALQRMSRALAELFGEPAETLLAPQIDSVAVSRNGRFAATANAQDQIVQIWDLETRSEVPRGAAQETGAASFLDRAGSNLIFSVTFSPDADAKFVLTVGGTSARLWDRGTSREFMSYSPHAVVASARYSHSLQHVVTSSHDGAARIWDAETGRGILKLYNAHRGAVNSAVFSSDDKLVLTAGDDGSVRLWDWTTEGAQPLDRLVRTIRVGEGRRPVYHAVFSADDRYILASSADGRAYVFSTETGAGLCVVDDPENGHRQPVRAAEFSKDGRWIVTGSDDFSAKLWRIVNPAERAAAREGAAGALALPAPAVLGVIAEDDERLLAEWVGNLDGHTGSVTSVAFSPDASRVLTGSADYTAKLWDVSKADDPEASETSTELLTLKEHKRAVTSVAFSPGAGRYVLTGSRDGTAILWLAADWTAPAPGQPVAVGVRGGAPR